jgi:hypothetical protein
MMVSQHKKSWRTKSGCAGGNDHRDIAASHQFDYHVG